MQRSDARLAPIVRRVLAADGVLEIVVGVVLLGFIGSPDDWLDVSRTVTFIAAGVFVAAAAVVLVAAIRPGTPAAFVKQLAFANIAGGAAIWAAALLSWDRFSAEGRWLISATADAFILVGVLELLALRRTSAP